MNRKHLYKTALAFVTLMWLPTVLFAQSKQKWIVTRVINTQLEPGVREAQVADFKEQEKLYMGKIININRTRLFFPKSLSKSNSYADTVFIKNAKTFKKRKDTEISFRYPGDELNCSVGDVTPDQCYVGASFMKLLGSKEPSLTYFELKANAPNFYSYKLCVIKKNKQMGLLMENSLILLILKNKVDCIRN